MIKNETTKLIEILQFAIRDFIQKVEDHLEYRPGERPRLKTVPKTDFDA